MSLSVFSYYFQFWFHDLEIKVYVLKTRKNRETSSEANHQDEGLYMYGLYSICFINASLNLLISLIGKYHIDFLL